MKSIGTKLLMAAVCLTVLAYFGLQGYRYFSAPYTTVLAYAYQEEESATVSGWVIREEQVLPDDTTGLLRLSRSGAHLTVQASSLGGGRVRVNAIDGMADYFDGEAPTLIIRNEDRPGMVGEVSAVLSRREMNIATMQLYRDRRGGLAVMVLEFDQPVPPAVCAELHEQPGIHSVTYLNLEGM